MKKTKEKPVPTITLLELQEVLQKYMPAVPKSGKLELEDKKLANALLDLYLDCQRKIDQP